MYPMHQQRCVFSLESKLQGKDDRSLPLLVTGCSFFFFLLFVSCCFSSWDAAAAAAAAASFSIVANVHWQI